MDCLRLSSAIPFDLIHRLPVLGNRFASGPRQENRRQSLFALDALLDVNHVALFQARDLH